ncbi:MAG TPA: methylmalonyl-CoA mutase, partial [Dehalococcoidia bacterium]|nr:methylmalonyl-CoA mutase [Dehalococcoidia bacterium]
ALRDSGMEVIYTGIRQSPQMIVQAASQEDVDVIGMSILSGAHLEILPEIMTLIQEQGMDDVIVVVGGIIPEVDRQPLKDLGIAEVFGPGAPTGSIVDYIQESMSARSKP